MPINIGFALSETDRYFLLNEESEKMEQLGVLRTNCIDCLDRTNITQVR